MPFLISGAQQSVRRWVVELPVAVSVVCLVVVEQPVVDPRCSTVTPSRFGPVAAPPATPPTPAPTAAPTGPPAAAPAAAPVAAPAAAPRSSASASVGRRRAAAERVLTTRLRVNISCLK